MNSRTSNLSRYLYIFVGISGCFSVLFGAWLAHGASHISMEDLSRLNTALNYQFIHTLALFVALIWFQKNATIIWLKISVVLFCLGIIGFSGTLYLKYLAGISFIGVITPYGGMMLALAWLSLAIAGKKQL